MDFTAPEMAEMFGVSVRTIWRRMREHGLTIRASYTQLFDAQLYQHVRALKQHFPDDGYRCILGLLRSRDIRVPIRRVKELARCDPNCVCLRWITSVHRRRTFMQALTDILGCQYISLAQLIPCSNCFWRPFLPINFLFSCEAIKRERTSM